MQNHRYHNFLSSGTKLFKSQQQAQISAVDVINKIFNDKSYTNPQKLSLLISQYQQRQQKLDFELSSSIKSQISSIQQSKQLLNQANSYMREANQKTQNIKSLFNQQQQFHQFMENVFTLNIFTSNLSKVIEQLTYFVDMDSELTKLQKIAEDQSKYIYVNSKLINLIQLRNALRQDVTWQRQNTLMRKQFVKVDNLETSFYDKIFQKFSNLLKYSKQSQQSIKNSVKVIQAYDKFLLQKGKPRQMRDRAINLIKQSIDQKFLQALSGHDQLVDIIQNAKFAMTDLIEYGDYVAQCFPKQFKILEICQQQYKQNIEKYIVPYFQRIQQQCQYGNLVILLGWIDEYELMLSRAGLDSTNLVHLKSKVKLMMPSFLDHNRQLIDDYIANCLAQDQKNYCRKFYEQAVRDGSDLVSFFPSDIFRFINQQAQIMQDKLKGQIFVEFVRCITESLKQFQKDLVENVIEQLEVIKQIDNDDKIVDYEYKLIMFVNNYNECLKHAGQSKQIFAQLVSQDYRSRIQKIFMNQVQKGRFNFIQNSTQAFLNLFMVSYKLYIQSHLLSFTHKCLQQNGSMIIQDNLSVQLNLQQRHNSLIQQQQLIINIIHYRMLVKQSLEFFVDAYVQQLIVFIRIIYDLNSPSSMIQKRQNMVEYTRKKLLQISQNNLQIHKQVFNSKVAISEAIKKDRLIFQKLIEGFNQSISKTQVTKLINKFTILSELFFKKKGQFQQLLNKVAQLWPDKASELIQVIFIVRDDIESRQATIPKRGMGINISNY